MPETGPRHMIEANLDDQLRPQRLPVATALRTPAAWSAGRVACETGRFAQCLQTPGQCGTFVIGDGRGEADMIELAILVVEAEQQRSDFAPLGKIAEAAHDAVGRPHPL